MSLTGEVFVLEAGPAFKLLAKSKLPEGVNATPAVVGNAMYIRMKNHMICVK